MNSFQKGCDVFWSRHGSCCNLRFAMDSGNGAPDSRQIRGLYSRGEIDRFMPSKFQRRCFMILFILTTNQTPQDTQIHSPDDRLDKFFVLQQFCLESSVPASDSTVRCLPSTCFCRHSPAPPLSLTLTLPLFVPLSRSLVVFLTHLDPSGSQRAASQPSKWSGLTKRTKPGAQSNFILETPAIINYCRWFPKQFLTFVSHLRWGGFRYAIIIYICHIQLYNDTFLCIFLVFLGQ